MILTEKQIEEFKEVVKPVMKYLNNRKTFHPHVTIIVSGDNAELLEGIACSWDPTRFNQYLNKDQEQEDE